MFRHLRQVVPCVAVLVSIVTAMFGSGGVAAAAPAAPTGLAPANGASITVPFTISWNAVTDPSGIAAYNWEVSNASTMSPVILRNSTNGTTTHDTVSGLANGTYFWHVQAVSGAFFQSAWSATTRFTVTGANAGEPGSATLDPPHGGTQFHPMETITFTWSAVAGATSYIFDAANDPNFPVATKVHFDNIPTTSQTLTLGDSEPQGTWFVRVQAVNANRITGVPSNVVTFTLSFNAPLPPPPSLLSPANGATAPLPINFTWTDVPNPQVLGYTLEVASDASFGNIVFLYNQITGPDLTATSLPAGTLFWRVNSTQGDSAPGVAAVTAWSSTGTFVVPSTPTMASLQVTANPASSGDGETMYIQFTAPAPAGGTVVSLTSSDPNGAPLPATFTMPAGFAFGQLQFQTGQVTAVESVTLTGKLASGSSASVSFTLKPPSLKSLTISSPITGGVPTSAIAALNGVAPAGGAVVSLSSSTASVQPPPTVTVAPGSASVSFNVPTSAVSAATTATLTATWNGQSSQAPLTLDPQQPPASISLSPTTVSGSQGSFATVTLAAPQTYDVQLPISTSNPAVATIDKFVTIPAGANGGFNIFITPVTTTTTVTFSVSGAGVTKSATLTVTPSGAPPPAGPTLSSVSLNPSTVAATASSQGTVTFSGAVSAATTVSLGSGNTAASVPPSVTVPAGGTSATFTVTTGFVSGTTTINITATAGGVTVSAPLTITQAPPGPTGVTGVTIAPSSIVGGATAQGTVSLGAAAPSGGTSVTLSSNSPTATVPASVAVVAGATSATFNVTTNVVNSPTSATITATGGGASASASMTVTPASGGTTTDTVNVTLAEYVVADKVLNVSATSTSSTATLQAYVTSSGALIGTLQNKGGGRYEGQLAWSTNPQNVTVKSSLGGSGSLAVTPK